MLVACLLGSALLVTNHFVATPPAAASSTVTFGYTGAAQTYVVPQGVYQITIEAFGAQGSGNSAGGRIAATFSVVPNTSYDVFVGGQGARPAGGWPNGGNGATSNNNGRGGGGSSSVQPTGTSFSDSLIVAGGGGGGSDCCYNNGSGGSGGYPQGTDSTSPFVPGQGGTQSSGGFGSWEDGDTDGQGMGGNGQPLHPSAHAEGGGGGGGWHGGGGSKATGTTSGEGAGGGGGSSYVRTDATNLVHETGVSTSNGSISITAEDGPFTQSIGRIRPTHDDSLCLQLDQFAIGVRPKFRPCDGGFDQDWTLEYIAPYVFRLRGDDSGLCLSLENNNIQSGETYESAFCSTGSETNFQQQFKSIRNGDTDSFMLLPNTRGDVSDTPFYDYCAQVPGQGGSGSFLKLWHCNYGGSQIPDHYVFKFDNPPVDEVTFGAADGQIIDPTLLNGAIGRLEYHNASADTTGFCTAFALKANNPLEKTLIGTAGHCDVGIQDALDSPHPDSYVIFLRGYDKRRAGQDWLSIHPVFLRIGPTLTGGGHDIAVYATLPDPAVGYQDVGDLTTQFEMQFSGHPWTQYYTLGYPGNITWSRAQYGCAGWWYGTATAEHNCLSSSGMSGSPWARWGTSQLLGVHSSSVIVTSSTVQDSSIHIRDTRARHRVLDGTAQVWFNNL